MSKALQKAAALEASLKKQRLQDELLNDNLSDIHKDFGSNGQNAGFISLKKKDQNKKSKNSLKNLSSRKDLDEVETSEDEMVIDSPSISNKKLSKYERKQAKKNNSRTDTQTQDNKYTFSKNAKKSAVLYVGHIPHGFYEDQMKAFLSQFGTIVSLRISRSRRTGRSKGYGFVEFEDPEIAQIVAETMDNYILEDKSMQFRQLPVERLHPKMFMESNIRRAVVSWRKEAREMHNRDRTIFEQEKQLKNLKKRDQKKAKQLAAMGIDYKFESGYNSQIANAMSKIRMLKLKARELGLAGALLGEYTGDTDEEKSENSQEKGDEMEIIDYSDLDSFDSDEEDSDEEEEAEADEKEAKDEDEGSDNDDEKDESLLRGEQIFLGEIKPMDIKRNKKGEILFTDEEIEEEESKDMLSSSQDTKSKSKSTANGKKRKADNQEDEVTTEQSLSKKSKQDKKKSTQIKANNNVKAKEEKDIKSGKQNSTVKDKAQGVATDKKTKGRVTKREIESSSVRSSPRRSSARLSGKN